MSGAWINRLIVRWKLSPLVPLGLGLGGTALGALAGWIIGGAWLHTLWLLGPIFFLTTLSRGLVSPNVTHAALERIPQMAGAGSAVIGAMQMLTGALAGFIVGMMFDAFRRRGRNHDDDGLRGAGGPGVDLGGAALPVNLALFSLVAALVAALVAFLALVAVLRQGRQFERLRLQAEQVLAGQRGETEDTSAAPSPTPSARSRAATRPAPASSVPSSPAPSPRCAPASTSASATSANSDDTASPTSRRPSTSSSSRLASARRAGAQLRLEVTTAIADMRTALDNRLRELREGNEAKLEAIQKTVNEQLHAAVEKQMVTSFQRVTEQFAQVQKAIGDVQAVTAQIGDLKRLFGNVKTRGQWGETQVRAMLEDVLPPAPSRPTGSRAKNSAEAVEFAVSMPGRGRGRVPPGRRRVPRRGLRAPPPRRTTPPTPRPSAPRGAPSNAAVRDEAKKIADKYIVPPATVEFAVMYLPTDGLYRRGRPHPRPHRLVRPPVPGPRHGPDHVPRPPADHQPRLPHHAPRGERRPYRQACSKPPSPRWARWTRCSKPSPSRPAPSATPSRAPASAPAPSAAPSNPSPPPTPRPAERLLGIDPGEPLADDAQ
jgi:hypothetical protein